MLKIIRFRRDVLWESTYTSYTIQIPSGSCEAKGVMWNLTHTYLPGWFLLRFQREHIPCSGMPSNKRLADIFWNLNNSKSSKHPSKVFPNFIPCLQTHDCLGPKQSLVLPILAAVCISFGCGWNQRTTRCAQALFYSLCFWGRRVLSNMEWTSWGSMVYLVCVAQIII